MFIYYSMNTILQYLQSKIIKLLDTQTYFCVSISYVETHCDTLLISIDFGMFAYYIYRVFKKEGGKVKGYYTTKKLILGAVWGFIVTVRMGHLINCIKLPKNFTFKLKIRPSNI